MPPILERTMQFESPEDDIDTVLDLLGALWLDAPDVPSGDRMRFETALIELAMNVLTHADDGSGVQCVLAIIITPDSLDAALTDHGLAAVLDLGQREMPDSFEESGRGIALVKALVDELDYARTGDTNRWHISKRLCA
ncbi:ATP-binding protein [uncultured Amnibacterium sp.]|uniref:ATP-binding protein n=1 Tax=uncultured Amnibacterium sp. TaxID=1631851 RepID=UPI0035CC8487